MKHPKLQLKQLIQRWAIDPRSQQLSAAGRQLDRLGLSLRRLTAPALQPPQAAELDAVAQAFPALEGVIYDVGANCGDNLGYYLKRAERVVAIEANPALCAQMQSRFAAEIAAGRLRVLNTAVSREEGEASFWIHRQQSVLSTLLTPKGAAGELHAPENFTPLRVATTQLSTLVRQHGAPAYIKIDVEGLDAAVLADLLAHNIRPPYLSAECFEIEVFCQLVAAGYPRFKIVEGMQVGHQLQRVSLQLADGSLTEQSFIAHSAGPFGEDIPMPWIDRQRMFRYLADRPYGWGDLHARRD